MSLPALLVMLLVAMPASRRPQEPDGKAIFEANCRKCHGPAGQPSAAMKKLIPELPTWNEAFFASRSESDIVNVLTNGKGKNMKPFTETLKPEEMVAVARYIRTLRP